jgi:hypothetical protein
VSRNRCPGDIEEPQRFYRHGSSNSVFLLLSGAVRAWLMTSSPECSTHDLVTIRVVLPRTDSDGGSPSLQAFRSRITDDAPLALAVFGVLLAVTACSDGSGTQPNALTALSFDDSVGFTEITDGAFVPLGANAGGGIALHVAPRLYGFDGGTVEARAVLTDAETSTEVARARDLILEMEDTGEGFADPVDEYADVLSLWVCSVVPSQTLIVAKPYELRLIVTNGSDTLTTVLSIQPVCSDRVDGCECVCLARGCS